MDDIPTHYANIIKVQRTPLDFSLIFGSKVAPGFEFQDPGDAEQDIGIQTSLCRILLSPTTAKILVKYLGDSVKAYERATGAEIPMPGGVEVTGGDSADKGGSA